MMIFSKVYRMLATCHRSSGLVFHQGKFGPMDPGTPRAAPAIWAASSSPPGNPGCEESGGRRRERAGVGAGARGVGAGARGSGGLRLGGRPWANQIQGFSHHSEGPPLPRSWQGTPPPRVSSESASRELWRGTRRAAPGTCGDIDTEACNERGLKD